MAKPAPRLSPEETERVIATAWDDRPPFHTVLRLHGLMPGQLVALLKRALSPSAYKLWQARTGGGAAGAPGRARGPRRPAAKPGR